MGMAGSLAQVTVDSMFHVVDTVNVRAKAMANCSVQSSRNLSTMDLTREIWREEGAKGFGKGFSACVLSATACGFVYFTLYKYLKGVCKPAVVDEDTDLTKCYLFSSIGAGVFTLMVSYPFDMIKARL